jgi:hypothetical protein
MRLSGRGPDDAHRRQERSGGRPKPSFLPREEGAGSAPGKRFGEAVARQRKACGKPPSMKAAGAAENEDNRYRANSFDQSPQ